ncbi:NAD(P)H-binding protein [Saccharopolyspora shandongensis]|uniref:NmrA family NAD(P)-binding protein n=1 Tax=Saccharopolyspora shandongensis TaxID=418495 RepID=UPI003407D0BF
MAGSLLADPGAAPDDRVVKILITTAAGSVGRELTELLRRNPDVRYLVRSDRSAASLGPVAGRIVRGDAGDPADVRAAVDGVERLYLAHPYCTGQAEVEIGLARAALEAGVTRIVKLGALPWRTAGEPDPVTGAHEVVVDRLQAMGVPELTVLRPDRFLQNFLGQIDSIAAGVLADPGGPGSRGFIDTRDIAEVAAAKLLAERPVGGQLPLSGPERVTVEALAGEFGAVVGLPVRYRSVVPDADWQARLVRTGLSAEYVAGLAALYRNYRAEAESELGTGVQAVLGRPPRSAADFASDVLAGALTRR